MSENDGFKPPVLHLGKNTKTVIGGYKPKTGTLKWATFGVKDSEKTKQKRMSRNGNTHRGKLNKLLPLVKRVICQEYVSQNGGEVRKLEKSFDLEHIHGKDGVHGGIPAVISPINLQLLDRKTHILKTDGLEISSHFDGRDKVIQARLTELAERIRRKAGINPNWKDYKAAYESEVYDE